MKRVALAEVKDHLSEYLNEAADEEVVITRHGRPAGVLVGFADDDDWFDYRLENDPHFVARIAQARESIRAGKAVPWDEAKELAEPEENEFKVSDRPAARSSRRGSRK
ncbi:type II toxin-antitoxin system Phd/YefM family antitoxin [candidate division WOR-3 bacterium]|nr:type II toxin-antitoxin system Phd/YefM family antitoxin [candidate division WOR-3 bacterium]